MYTRIWAAAFSTLQVWALIDLSQPPGNTCSCKTALTATDLCKCNKGKTTEPEHSISSKHSQLSVNLEPNSSSSFSRIIMDMCNRYHSVALQVPGRHLADNSLLRSLHLMWEVCPSTMCLKEKWAGVCRRKEMFLPSSAQQHGWGPQRVRKCSCLKLRQEGASVTLTLTIRAATPGYGWPLESCSYLAPAAGKVGKAGSTEYSPSAKHSNQPGILSAVCASQDPSCSELVLGFLGTEGDRGFWPKSLWRVLNGVSDITARIPAFINSRELKMIPGLWNSKHANNEQQLGNHGQNAVWLQHPSIKLPAIPRDHTQISSDTYLSFVPVLHGYVLNALDLVAYEHVLLNHNFLPFGVASGSRKAKVMFRNLSLQGGVIKVRQYHS